MPEKVEVISDFPYLCGETPMWDTKTSRLLWSDMLAGKLFAYDVKDKEVSLLAEGKNVSGFTMNRGGGLVCATHQGVYLWDEARGFQLAADVHNGHRLQCNDATADARGRFLFGSTFYGPNSCLPGSYPLGKLFSMDQSGEISVLDEGIHLSNGIAFSPDNHTLYYTDTIIRTIYAYDYNLAQGTVSNRRVLVRIPEEAGVPDGLTVDAEGYLWSAHWYGSRIVRYSPGGNVERVIYTPAKQTSSLVFGGTDFTDLFVTSAALSVRLPIAPQGYDFEADYIGGATYRYNFGIKGRPEYIADISLEGKK
jgi:sugar lactone lactonase YvrE